MISSYQFSNRFDTVTILAAGLSSLFAFLRTLALLLLGAVCLAATFAVVVAFWLPICQVIGALAIIAAFGWATYPRTRAPRSGWGVRNGQ